MAAWCGHKMPLICHQLPSKWENSGFTNCWKMGPFVHGWKQQAPPHSLRMPPRRVGAHFFSKIVVKFRQQVAHGNPEPHTILRAEACVVHLAKTAFNGDDGTALHFCVENPTVMNIMARGNAHSDALVKKVSAVDKLLRGQGIHATWGHAASENNPEDGISLGRAIKRRDVVSGSAGGGSKAFSALPFRQKLQNRKNGS